MGDVALRGSLLRRSALSSKVAPAVSGAGRCITGAVVGREPTTAVDADAGTGVEVDRWSRSGTPSDTSEEHYRMEQPQPSSSWFHCGRGWHHPLS
jgi:hypothetical protein